MERETNKTNKTATFFLLFGVCEYLHCFVVRDIYKVIIELKYLTIKRLVEF